MYRVAIVVFAIISTSFAQIVVKGKCPSVRAVQPFDKTKFGGKWYEWARYPNPPENETRCNMDNWVFSDNNVLNISYSSISIDGKKLSSSASTVISESTGQFNLTVSELDNARLESSILGTDYNNWAVLFACTDLDGDQHQRYLWFYTRSSPPSVSSILAVTQIILSQGISAEPMEPVIQLYC